MSGMWAIIPHAAELLFLKNEETILRDCMQKV
jgi:hypothetical protein